VLHCLLFIFNDHVDEATVQATIDEIRGMEESNSREAIALERSRVVELEENLRRLQMVK